MDLGILLTLVRFVKFASIFAYLGGVGVGLSSSDLAVRKRAVHLISSPALLSVWLAGYVLTLHLRVPLLEAWIVGGFVCSLAMHLLVTRAVRERTLALGMRLGLVLTLGATLAFMVFRPTWWSLTT